MNLEELNNSIIICDNNVKEYILSNTTFLNVSFKTYSEAINDILGEYDDVIYDIAKNNNVTISLSKSIFDSFLLAQNGISDKLDNVCKIKNKYKLNYIKPINYKKVYVINYYFNNDLLNYALKKIDYESIYLYPNKNVKKTLYEANTQFDEAFYVLNEIAKLIASSKTNILVMAPSNYYSILKEYSKDFNIDLLINENVSLYEIDGTKDFFDNVDLNMTVKEAINKLIANPIYNPIVNKLNNLNINDELIKEAKEYLIYLFKNTYIEYPNYNNVIKVTNDVPLDTEYLFILGLNQGINPKIYQDTNYINDLELNSLGLETSTKKNIYERKRLTDIINNVGYVYLSNCKISNGKKLEKSLYLNQIEYEKTDFSLDEIYSIKALEKLGAIMLDNYYKYNDKNPNLDRIISSTNQKYNYYDNSYKGHFSYNLKDLSYSKMDTYLRCPFRFYLSYGMKFNDSDSFYLDLGNYFHYMLEKCNTEEDVDLYTNEIREKVNFEKTNKMDYFVSRYNMILKELIRQFNECMKQSKFTLIEREKKFEFSFDDVRLNGKVDLILTNPENNNSFIIDYKTGDFKFDLNEIEFGAGLQLPVYMMFLKKMEKNPCGAFIKNIIPSNLNEGLEKAIQKNTKLDGIFINDKSVLNEYMENDSNIVGISDVGKQTKRSLSKDEIEKIIDIANEHIRNTIKKIKDNNFKIEPYKIYKKGKAIEESCKYCNFRNICYKRNSSFKRYDVKDDLSIIGRGVEANEVE